MLYYHFILKPQSHSVSSPGDTHIINKLDKLYWELHLLCYILLVLCFSCMLELCWAVSNIQDLNDLNLVPI